MKSKASNAYLDAMREIDILRELNSPYIIQIHEVIDDDKEDKLYLVLDYAHRGQIMDYDVSLKKFRANAENRTYYTEKEV